MGAMTASSGSPSSGSPSGSPSSDPRERLDWFELDPRLTHLNHASFGAPTRAALDAADARRREIERDSTEGLGEGLVERLAPQAAAVEALLGARPGSLALTENSTEGDAALATSLAAALPLRPGDHVLLLDVEYPSVLRAWAVACERAGATCDVARLPLPASAADVLAAVEAAHPATRVLVLSAITSSTALAMPLAAAVGAAHARGMTVVVDAAHVAGHVPVDLEALGADAALGSLHKWLPVPRAVGFLWLAEHLRDAVRPAVVSLDWDAGDLVRRFGWRGTWDPAPALGLADAIAQRAAWDRAGLLEHAVAVSDALDAGLREPGPRGVGLRPTAADPALVPPRLRAYLVDDASLAGLRAALAARRVRAWTGPAPDGTPVLRLATHVYSAAADLAPVLTAVRSALRDAAEA